jgi:hypothetical protein
MDSTPLQWTQVGIGLFHADVINDGTSGSGFTPNDDDYIETQTANDADQVTFRSVPDNVQFVTQIDVNIRCWIDDADGETDSYIELRLYHNSTEVTGNPKTINSTDLGGQRVLAEVTRSWTGLNLTKAEANTLELRATLVDPS